MFQLEHWSITWSTDDKLPNFNVTINQLTLQLIDEKLIVNSVCLRNVQQYHIDQIHQNIGQSSSCHSAIHFCIHIAWMSMTMSKTTETTIT